MSWSPGGAPRPGEAGAEEEDPSSRQAPPGRLRGKVALVTGGGSGIGREVACLLAREGASIVVVGRRSDPLQETVREIRRLGGVATFARGDVSRAERVEMVVQSATYNFGGLDILVNNAGIFLPGSVLGIDERRWDRVMGINLKGPYLVSRAAIPAMRARGGGSIVNIAAAAGLAGMRDAAAYSASKGGLVALTRSMALDLAPDRIRVNAICPGPVDSSGSGSGSEGKVKTEQAMTRRDPPLGRAGTPADVASLALYLASDEAGWVTGSIFSVDGGLLAG